MAGQKFQYDESGSTFVYFLLSFLALILVPATYYSWPRKEKQDPEKAEKECRCEHCLAKKARLVRKDPWQLSKKVLIRLAIFLGWALFFYAAYQTSKYDYEYANFDPYEILQIELGSSPAAIKKAYHKLSLIHHPDKETGDEKAFMRLTKAYQALTDETARRNWELYGNPDGPGAMSFGIALPSWIVEKENSLWVLGLYALVFMVALPTAVGTWWYRSIRYSGEQVLLDTTQMYYYFFHKTPQMVLKRTIMILAASAEFYRRHNPEIHERPSDNAEVPYLIKILPQLNEKNKERPLCFAYSVKARALLHAHLSRLQLPPNTLEIDRLAVIRKCPVLIQEMVVCVSQLIMLAHAGRLSRMPALTTIEGCMKLSQMIVQALWEHKSPFLQLPHIDDDSLKYFSSKRHQVRSLEQLARMKEDERRFLLRHLNDPQYEDVIRVLGQMPYIDMDVVCEVVDDEHTTVYTAGAIITVTVTLTRKPMESLFDKEGAVENGIIENGAEGNEEDDAAAAKKKPSPWQKGPKKSKKSSSNSKKGTKKPATKTANPNSTTAPTTAATTATTATTTAAPKKEKDSDQESESGSDESDQESQEESQKVPANQSSAPEDDDEEDWSKFQERITNKRQKVLEGRSKVSHSVHCPFFSDDKQEYWWVYISDRKQQLLLTAPYHVTNLVDREEIQLKFTAPMKPGNYTFAVVLKSDSYMGFDQMKDIKMDVKEAPAVPTEHPQWDISDDEEEKKDSTGSESEFATDDEDADLDQDD